MAPLGDFRRHRALPRHRFPAGPGRSHLQRHGTVPDGSPGRHRDHHDCHQSAGELRRVHRQHRQVPGRHAPEREGAGGRFGPSLRRPTTPLCSQPVLEPLRGPGPAAPATRPVVPVSHASSLIGGLAAWSGTLGFSHRVPGFRAVFVCG